MSTETVKGEGQVQNDPVDASVPESMGIEEALDFIQGEHKETSDYDGVATDGDDDDQDDLDDDKDDETTDDDDQLNESDEDDHDDDSDSDEEQETGEDDDDEKGDLDEDTVVFTLEDGDDEISVNAKEAKKGYMRNKDYTVKTQEVAKELTEAKAAKTSLLETQGKYVEALGLAKAAQSEELKNFIGVDWVTLQKDDPIEYEEKEKEFTAATLAYQQTVLTQEVETEKLQLASMEYFQEVRKEEMGKLATFLPEVAEEGNTLLQDVLGFAAEKYGFTEEELLNTYDHRHIRALADAFKGQKQAAKLEKGHKKAKGVKTQKSKASRSGSMQKARKAKARKAVLNQEGGISINEALNLL